MSALTVRAVAVCSYCSERFAVDYARGSKRSTPCAANWQHEYTRTCGDCGPGSVIVWEQGAWANTETCDTCGASDQHSIGD